MARVTSIVFVRLWNVYRCGVSAGKYLQQDIDTTLCIFCIGWSREFCHFGLRWIHNGMENGTLIRSVYF